MAKEVHFNKTIEPHYLNQLLITWISKNNFEYEKKVTNGGGGGG